MLYIKDFFDNSVNVLNIKKHLNNTNSVKFSAVFRMELKEFCVFSRIWFLALVSLFLVHDYFPDKLVLSHVFHSRAIRYVKIQASFLILQFLSAVNVSF